MSARQSARSASSIHWFLFGGGTLLYGLVSGLQQGGSLWALGPAAVASSSLYAWIWRSTRQTEVGEQRLPLPGLWSVRLSVWGAGLWAIAHFGGNRAIVGRAMEGVGLAAACIGANFALACLPPVRGLAHFRRDRSVSKGVAVCLAAGLPIVLPIALPSVLPFDWVGGKAPEKVSALFLPGSLFWVGEVAASVVALAITGLNTWRQVRRRRFELGAADRASSAYVLGGSLLVVAGACALSGLLPLTTALPAATVCIGLSLCWLVTLHDTQVAAGALRAAAAIAFFGLPLLAACAIGSQRLATAAPAVAAMGVGLGLAAGFVARRLSARVAPDTARWLKTLRAAAGAALEPESTSAINATLVALQALERGAETSPELWRPSPQEVLRVDVAGYLHRESASGPTLAYSLARDEPEGVLRTSLLEHVQVSRPEVRPVLGWLQSREAGVAILVSQGEDDYGLLVLPKGNRRRELSWEEAHVCGQVAGRLASILSLSAVLYRAKQRESIASARVTELQAEIVQLRNQYDNCRASKSNLSQWIGRAATAAHFGATVRDVARRLEKLSKRGDNLLLHAPVGSNVVSWACWCHGLSPRAEGPVVVVDCTVEPAEGSRDVESLDPVQVLSMAHEGTVVLLHLNALKIERQEKWSDAIVDQTMHGDPPRCIVTVPAGQDVVRSDGGAEAFDSALMRALRCQHVALPSVGERPEDIRGLVFEHLCRSAIRREGSVLGVDVFAMERLVEHSWPGNERELQSIVEIAAARASQQTIRIGDLWPASAASGGQRGGAAEVSSLPIGRRGSSVTTVAEPASLAGPGDGRSGLGNRPAAVAEGPSRRRRRK